MRRFTIGILSAGLLLSGCANNEQASTLLGQGIGAIAGAMLGTEIGAGRGNDAAIALGTLLGAFVGGQVGRRLSQEDWTIAGKTQQQTLETAPSGSARSWTNPDTGARGSVSAEPAHAREEAAVCRRFSHTIESEGENDTLKGVACRQADGTWKVIEGDRPA